MVTAVALAWLLGIQAVTDCTCLDNGGQPGPGNCPCNVEQCYADCVNQLCPEAPNCMLECSRRCTCNDAVDCPTHVDPGPTPTAVPLPQTYSITACYSEVPYSSCSPFGVPYDPPSLYGPVPDGTSHPATRDPRQEYPSYTFTDLVPGNYILGAGGCNPFGCRIASMVTVADEDVFAVVPMVPPRRSPLFRICASAAQRPGDSTPAQYAVMTLLPTLKVAKSESSGVFCFHEVAPGDYLITTAAYPCAGTSCTADGCWQDTQVTVTDANVLDVFVAMDPLPTPTPTPCLGDGNNDRLVTIDELVGAVAHALDGCR